MEQVQIQGRTFMKGKSKCPTCKRNFKYIFPFESLLVWDRQCVQCGTSFPEQLPEKGKIVFLTLEME